MRQYKNSWPRIADARVKVSGERVTCYKGYSCAKCVGMPIMGNRSVPVHGNIGHGAMRIIDVWEPIAIGLAATACVPIRKFARILWSLQYGTKCVSCSKTLGGWSGNIT